ncbi:MAG: hypothetical protein IJM30_02870 [Thermoguttaceae bacterium]|nr:hypothetical protein [Thermoguttaceae bacterium]
MLFFIILKAFGLVSLFVATVAALLVEGCVGAYAFYRLVRKEPRARADSK